MQCHICFKTFNTFESLVTHYDKKEGFNKKAMKGHYIHDQYLKERARKRFKFNEITQLEFEHVGLVEEEGGQVDEQRYKCLARAKEGKSYNGRKREVIDHMMTHGVIPQISRNWLCAKDGNRVKHNTRYGAMKLQLTRAITARSSEQERNQESDPNAESDILMGGPQGDDAFDERPAGTISPRSSSAEQVVQSGSASTEAWLPPTSKASPLPQPQSLAVERSPESEASRSLRNIATSLDAFTQRVEDVLKRQGAPAVQEAGTKLEVEIPKITLGHLIQTFKKEDLKEDAKHHKCPIPGDESTNLEGFEKYLKTRVPKIRAKTTVHYIMLAINRFFNLFDINGENIDFIGILVALHEDETLINAIETELLDPARSWSNKIASALNHLCNYGISVCKRKRFTEARNSIEQLQEHVVIPYKNRCHDLQHEAGKKMAREMGERLDNLAKYEDFIVAVKKAMIALHLLSEDTKDGKELTEEQKVAANIFIIGIIYHNGFAGRSGEWKRAKKQHFFDQIEKGLEYIICPDHKTARYWGELAKYLFPGTVEALKVYLALPGKLTDLLLEPVREGTVSADVVRSLKAFGADFLPGFERPACNMIRKKYSSEYIQKTREGEFIKLLEKGDAHGSGVILDTYAITTAKNDATVGKKIHLMVFGDAVPWPSPEELSEAEKNRVYDYVEKAARQRAGAEDTSEDEPFPKVLRAVAPTSGSDSDSSDEPRFALRKTMAANIHENEEHKARLVARYEAPRSFDGSSSDDSAIVALKPKVEAKAKTLKRARGSGPCRGKRSRPICWATAEAEVEACIDAALDNTQSASQEPSASSAGNAIADGECMFPSGNETDNMEGDNAQKEQVAADNDDDQEEQVAADTELEEQADSGNESGEHVAIAGAEGIEIPRKSRPHKIDDRLRAFIFEEQFKAESGTKAAKSHGWFQKLKERAVREGLMKENTASAEGMREVVRKYFREHKKAEAAASTKS